MGAVISFLLSLPAIFKGISDLVGIVNELRRLFRKDPVDQLQKDQKANDQANKDAGAKDDTSGAFNG